MAPPHASEQKVESNDYDVISASNGYDPARYDVIDYGMSGSAYEPKMHKEKDTPQIEPVRNNLMNQDTNPPTQRFADQPYAQTSDQSNGQDKVQKTFADGRTVVWYSNGTQKERSADGSVTVSFTNGDRKRMLPEGVVTYYYASADTRHTAYPDGLEVFEFPSKQVERHFPDGTKQVLFPDGTEKLIGIDGVHVSTFPDGVVLHEYPDGRREVMHVPRP